MHLPDSHRVPPLLAVFAEGTEEALGAQPAGPEGLT